MASQLLSSQQLTNRNTLRSLLKTSDPCICMSSHNPLSAKLAVEAGFSAVWVSGFELSASFAVPDASILSMSAHLDATRAIHQSVPTTPLVVDCDTGWGNAVNVAYNIPKFAAAGASAVVLEDKTFPKDSSLRSDGRQVCLDIEEFQGKVRAAKECGGGILVIARTEALIAGLGQDEALQRAQAYADAGADAILVHSKQRTPDEILAFCQAWKAAGSTVPLALVPTSYPQLSFRDIGALDTVGMVICGNHAIRAAITGMRRCFEQIREEGGIAGADGKIASVQDVFAVMGDAEMRELETKYL